MSRFLLALLFLCLALWPALADDAPPSGLTYPQPTAPVKKALPGVATADVHTVLAVAAKYYQRASNNATAEEKGALPQIITWKPDFTGKTTNAALALTHSMPSAYLAGFTDLKGIYLAYNAAVFTLDTKSATGAGNVGSAIAAYAEDLLKQPLADALKLPDTVKKGSTGGAASYAADALTAYEYALALRLQGGMVDASALPQLLNYGYLCIDMGKLANAKVAMQTAALIAPDYLPACEGLSAYWLAKGDKQQAQDALKNARKPMILQKLQQAGEDSSEDAAPTIPPGEDLGTMESQLKKLAAVPTLLATDFYEDMDPEGAGQARRFVSDLSGQWQYATPACAYLLEFSTLPAFRDHGRAAIDGLKVELESFTKAFAQAQYQNSANTLDAMGLKINLGGVDINDLMKNPEKYKNTKIKGKVDNADKIKQQAAKLAQQFKNGEISMQDMQAAMQKLMSAMQGGKDANGGGTDSGGDAGGGGLGGIAGMAAKVAPEAVIYQMDPGDYADPTDLVTQRYNMTILTKKIQGHKNYLKKLTDEMQQVVMDDMNKLSNKIEPLQKGMDNELAAWQKEYDDWEKAGRPQGKTEDYFKLKKHHIHEQYLPQLNQIAESTWCDATNFIGSRYMNKVKPAIAVMYSDCMKNCMLITDAKIRQRKDDEIRAALYQSLFMAMNDVGMAYGLYPGDYPYHCDCDPAELEKAREREQKAFDEEQAMKTVMENKARQEFQQGTIKESTQLYKQLDKYSAEYSLAFMHAKWHPLKTEVTMNVKIPMIKTGFNAKMVEDHVRNTTTYGGGMTVSTSGKLGKVGIGGSVSLQGEVTTDGNGNITRADVISTAKGSASLGSYEASATYEASVMRGCKLSGEVTKLTADQLKPPNAPDAWKDFTEATSPFLPAKPTKTLWKGEYQVTK